MTPFSIAAITDEFSLDLDTALDAMAPQATLPKPMKEKWRWSPVTLPLASAMRCSN